MAIDEKRLLELCKKAASEKNSKKRLALTQQIDCLLAAACEARERAGGVTQSLSKQSVVSPVSGM